MLGWLDIPSGDIDIKRMADGLNGDLARGAAGAVWTLKTRPTRARDAGGRRRRRGGAGFSFLLHLSIAR